LQLERPAMRICDLLLGPPPDWVRSADRLDEAVGQLRADPVRRREADAEQKAIWTFTVQVRDLMWDNADGSSSLVAS
jgi:hypothetical protein